MAMFDNQPSDLVSEINMTPLIDVMLVLLIVFMITLPVVTNTIKVDLPAENSAPTDAQSAHVDLSVDAGGAVSWDGAPLDPHTLATKLAEAATHQPQPDIQIYADRSVRYEAVADLLAATQRAGLSKINFVTKPQS
ncbi:MAG: biopolymer transporter ExbD [Burkholderia sp.]|jgi:biopolymer transport protein ExbD|uniref:ExbD/TolR family protein n=1 Tax=Burkholderia sp. TaxID=36773 RepID=UPI002825DAE6|nr:biopolymer transporter ExbD [Burkholderia sp.]MDR0245595.1 biopolymer transporter ExbD [Burkholderia sp.]